jgi:large subunit ribosomal protein L13
MKTYSQKPAEVSRKWVQLDASEAPLGRLATTAAKYLIGKYKPTYTAHIDGGDYVVVTNAAKLVVTGNKLEDKKYYRHSGFPGGIKERTLAEQLVKDPTKVIYDAVTGMLPKNKLQDGRLKRLKVFAGEEHAHTAQTPTKVEVEK